MPSEHFWRGFWRGWFLGITSEETHEVTKASAGERVRGLEAQLALAERVVEASRIVRDLDDKLDEALASYDKGKEGG